MQEKSVKAKSTFFKKMITFLVVFIIIPVLLYLTWRLDSKKYYITSVILIILSMVPFFLRFEKRKPQARELVTLAVLCAIAVISRVAFIMVPHFKPMAGIVMIAGLAFGSEVGFLTGAISAFVSNFVFMQGVWTPWQMFAYGIGGFVIGFLGKTGVLKQEKRIPVAIVGGLVILCLVGPILDTSSLFTMGIEINMDFVKTTYMYGLPLNAVHAVATTITLFLLAKPMCEKLDRIKVKYGVMSEE